MGQRHAGALHGADVGGGDGLGDRRRQARPPTWSSATTLFATLMYGLGEGRRIVDNVQKGLIFLISTHVALLGFILIATIYGFGQPLLPLQILWLELFIDTSTTVAFELEKAEPDLMRRPPRQRGVPLLTNDLLGRDRRGRRVQRRGSPGRDGQPSGHGPARPVAGVYEPGLRPGRPGERQPKRPRADPPPGPELVPAGGRRERRALIQAAIPYVPVLAEAFRATPLDPSDWAIVAVIALIPALLAETVRTVTGRTWVA
mgnify:CR=1 FL=1